MPTVVTLSNSSMPVSDEHPSNDLCETVVILLFSGTVTVVSFLQSINDAVPVASRLAGKTTVLSSGHESNERSDKTTERASGSALPSKTTLSSAGKEANALA